MTLPLETLYKPERMANLTSTQVGTIGEYLVASILGGFGVEITRADASSYDLLALIGDRPIRIDVKTTATDSPRRGFWVGKGKTGNIRPFGGSGCDLFALVCLEDHAIFFDTCAKHAGKKIISLSRANHQNKDSYDSWLTSLEELLPK